MAGIDLSGLNKGQREVVERLDEPLFVSAGAGSGKTHTLTARLVHALSQVLGGDLLYPLRLQFPQMPVVAGQATDQCV